MKSKCFILVLSLFLILSCKKQEIIPDNDSSTEKLSLKAGYIQTPFFDWENSQYIYYQGTPYYLPWESGANADIPMEVKADFKMSEGWRLLYNTFPNNEVDPVLILYNAYRGTLRSYYFVTNTAYTNNMWTWGFGAGTTGSANTSALNFAWNSPSPLNVRKPNPQIFKVNWCGDSTILPSGIVPGYWYSSEFELAYDPNIVNLNHDQLELQFRGFASQRQAVIMNGTIDGSLKGTFDMPKSSAAGGLLSSFADFPWISTGKDSSKISLMTKQMAEKYLNKKVAAQTNTTLKNLLTSGLNDLIGNGLSLSNPILKVLGSVIFTPKSSSTGIMNLTLAASTKSTGTISSNYPGPSKAFFFPGSQQSSNKGGLLPYYNYNLGVWNIDQTPTVKYSVATIQRSTERTKPEVITQTYTLSPSSFNLIINPIVTGYENAAITLQKKELIFYQKSQKLTSINGELIDSQPVTYLTANSIRITYSGLPLGQTTTYNYGPNEFGSFKVRATLAIRPIGFTQDVILVKEFPVKWIAQ